MSSGRNLCVIGGAPHWAQVESLYCIYHAGGQHRAQPHPSTTPAGALSDFMTRCRNDWRHGVGPADDVISWKRPL